MRLVDESSFAALHERKAVPEEVLGCVAVRRRRKLSVNGETTASSLTAFGAETHNSKLTTHNPASDSFFTGKPFVPGLGHAFLFRNYRSDLGKWQTADPLGYPDGWNQLAYCGNRVMDAVDLWGGKEYDIPSEMRDFYFDYACNMVGQNNPCLLEDISRRTRNAAANAAYPVVYHSLGPDIIYAYEDDWTRTGRTRNENGYTEYEEEKWEYKYKYDVYLVLMKVSYGTDGWWRAVALGLGLGGIAAGGPVGWTIGVGGSALGIGDWLLSGTDYVPLGVVFELKSKEKVPNSRKTQWVE